MKKLHEWFEKNRREFPWRVERTPYRVWISEVMLQQTRASVVVGYFQRWMEIFPTIKDLAEAPLEKVIKAWEGLGYYSRARNLHAAAKQILESFGGEIPSYREDLEKIKGLGPYTIGALLSFGFQKRAPAVDGNVTRVLSRFLLIEENVCKQAVKKKIEVKAEELLDAKEPWITAEAFIELGATICTKLPRCSECPLQSQCLGYKVNKAESLPIKNEPEKVTELHRAVLLIEAGGKILIRKGEAGRVMADLYEFPYFEMGKERWTERNIIQKIEKEFGLKVFIAQRLSEVSHSFTRYKAHLYPLLLETPIPLEADGFLWVSRSELFELPFSAGHRKILRIAFFEGDMISLQLNTRKIT